jgi:hypothetical protein
MQELKRVNNTFSQGGMPEDNWKEKLYPVKNLIFFTFFSHALPKGQKKIPRLRKT